MNHPVHQGDYVRPLNSAEQSILYEDGISKNGFVYTRWRTPWHEYVDADGVLASLGNFRVILEESQWVLERFNIRWKPISYHREPDSLLRILREKQRTKGNDHLIADLQGLHDALEGML